MIERGADLSVIRRMGELYGNDGTAAEVDAQRNAMPEEHGENAGHAEDQREREEVPFLTKKIDVCIAKEFHESLWIIGRAVRVRTTFSRWSFVFRR